MKPASLFAILPQYDDTSGAVFIPANKVASQELLAAQAGATVGPASDDLEEVVNHVEALEYGLERLDALPLSLRLIRVAFDAGVKPATIARQFRVSRAQVTQIVGRPKPS